VSTSDRIITDHGTMQVLPASLPIRPLGEPDIKAAAAYAARRLTECDDLYVEPGCHCATVIMAPCSWCEHGGQYDADGQPVTPGDGEL